MAKRIGSLSVSLGLNSRPFTSGMASAGASIKRLTGGMITAGVQVAKYGAVAGGVALGITAAIVKQQMGAIDATAKFSDTLGINIQKLQAYRHAANLAGVGQAQFDKSLQRMVRNIGDAEQGLGMARDALDLLGISSRDLATMSPDEQFAAIAEGISKVENQSVKASTAYAIFGRSGIDLINVLNGGAAGLASAEAEAMKLGLTMNRIDAAKVEMANDAITRIKLGFMGAAQTLTVALVPYIEAAANKLIDFGTSGTITFEKISAGANMVALGVARIIDKVLAVAVPVARVGQFIEGIQLGIIKGMIRFSSYFRQAVSAMLGIAASAAAKIPGIGDSIASGLRSAAGAVDFADEKLAQLANGIDTFQNARGKALDFVGEFNAEAALGEAKSVAGGFLAEIQADAEKRAKEIADAAADRAAQSAASADFLAGLNAEAEEPKAVEVEEKRTIIEDVKKPKIDLAPLSLTQAGSAEAQRSAFASIADSIRVEPLDEDKQQLEEQRKGNTWLAKIDKNINAFVSSLKVMGVNPS